MKVDNNLNNMIKLTEKLEKNAADLTKLNNSSNQKLQTAQPNSSIKDSLEKENIETPDIIESLTEQIQIPIAYTANAQVISVHDSTTKTILDIKA